MDFSPTTKADWLDKVTRDLKGRSIEDLDYQWTEQISLSPFFHQSDNLATAPLTSQSASNWQIGNHIEVQDTKKANALLLDDLLHGVNAPRLSVSKPLSANEWEQLLEGVEPSYISLILDIQFQETDPAKWLDLYLNELGKKNCSADQRQGALRFGEEAISKLLNDWNVVNSRFPRKRKFYIDNTSNFQPLSPEKELALGAYMAFYRMLQAKKEGIDLSVANDNLHIVFSVGKSFFRNLAKLRAFRILWANILQAANFDLNTPPFLSIQFAPESYGADVHTNMIQATTQAMAAIFGGADRLEIAPANYPSEEATNLTRRVARNLHHILQMEAHLDQVIDPAAGSYFIEELSQTIAEKSFDLFKNMKALG